MFHGLVAPNECSRQFMSGRFLLSELGTVYAVVRLVILAGSPEQKSTMGVWRVSGWRAHDDDNAVTTLSLVLQ